MSQREWVAAAIRKIEADFNRSADTHLIPMDLPGHPGIELYFKDESSHPTGSLKHRWRARCSCTRWPTAGCAKGAR